MKLLLLALFLLIIQSSSRAQETEDNVTSTHDYMVQVHLNISEAKIPTYLVDAIYNRPTQKGISSQTVLSLFQADTISLASTENILQALNISHDQVFSIDNFNHTLKMFNWTFANFYTTITDKLNLSGAPLRAGLVALGIDVNQFSGGIAWGDPDPWQEFIKGNFTKENLEKACTEAGITLETLWAGVRDILLTNLITFKVNDLVQLLRSHNIREEHALIIWKTVPITVEHVYSQALFNELFGNISQVLQNQTVLGVLTTPHEVVIHRSHYDSFKEDRELLDIYAETLLTMTVLNVSNISDTVYRNLVILKNNDTVNNLTVINVAYQNSNVSDCTYVTLQDNNILSVNVSTANYVDETYEFSRNSIQNVIPGSALVCNNSVYGLARGVVGDLVVADAFSNYVGPPVHGSANSMFAGSLTTIFNSFGSLLVAFLLRNCM